MENRSPSRRLLSQKIRVCKWSRDLKNSSETLHPGPTTRITICHANLVCFHGVTGFPIPMHGVPPFGFVAALVSNRVWRLRPILELGAFFFSNKQLCYHYRQDHPLKPSTIDVLSGGARRGKAWMIQARVHGRKHSKSKSSPDLWATYSGVCFVETELKSNDSSYSCCTFTCNSLAYVACCTSRFAMCS